MDISPATQRREGLRWLAPEVVFRIYPSRQILQLVCAEMRGCATHLACLILLLLSNDSSMN
jgi:hypothetical protein